jgi:hypothetical protein
MSSPSAIPPELWLHVASLHVSRAAWLSVESVTGGELERNPMVDPVEACADVLSLASTCRSLREAILGGGGGSLKGGKADISVWRPLFAALRAAPVSTATESSGKEDPWAQFVRRAKRSNTGDSKQGIQGASWADFIESPASPPPNGSWLAEVKFLFTSARAILGAWDPADPLKRRLSAQELRDACLRGNDLGPFRSMPCEFRFCLRAVGVPSSFHDYSSDASRVSRRHITDAVVHHALPGDDRDLYPRRYPLVPVYGHRMMPCRPDVPGNPVYSMHQGCSDCIVYGMDFWSYLAAESRSDPVMSAIPAAWKRSSVRRVKFWSFVSDAGAYTVGTSSESDDDDSDASLDGE